MLRAIIFDFNGVIADDETPHFLAFQQALAEHGFTLTREDYYGTYLGMDERNCLAALQAATRGASHPALMEKILDRKAALFRDYAAKQKPPLFPGVVEFMKRAGERYRLAIASGGRREQIDCALQDTPIEKDFAVIVSAEDITVGKPDPQVYLLALKRLNEHVLLHDGPQSITRSRDHQITKFSPSNCLVIEDSLAGIRAARAADMKVVALATTYPSDQLAGADLVLQRLDQLPLDPQNALLDFA